MANTPPYSPEFNPDELAARFSQSAKVGVDDLKKIKTVEFVKMPKGTVTYKIKQTYEQFNKEPVFG